MVFNTLFSFLIFFPIPNTSKIQFFAHTQQNDVYSFPRVAPNCKLRKNFTVDAGAVLHGCSSILSSKCACVCVRFEREKERKTPHLVRWLENWYESRWDWEENERERENDVQNVPFPVVFRETCTRTRRTHTNTHSLSHAFCACLCISLTHKSGYPWKQFQAVPFHCAHTNTRCRCHWCSHISVPCVCLCISMLYRRLGDLQYSLPFEEQQQ